MKEQVLQTLPRPISFISSYLATRGWKKHWSQDLVFFRVVTSHWPQKVVCLGGLSLFGESKIDADFWSDFGKNCLNAGPSSALFKEKCWLASGILKKVECVEMFPSIFTIFRPWVVFGSIIPIAAKVRTHESRNSGCLPFTEKFPKFWLGIFLFVKKGTCRLPFA